MRSPSVCVTDHKDFTFENCYFLAMPSAKRLDSHYGNIEIIQNLGVTSNPTKRFQHLAAATCNFLVHHKVEKVLIEDYAFGGSGRVFQIGENGGVLKLFLLDFGIDVDLIAPTSLKKFATGKGNAKKQQMIEQFESETGVDLWEHFCIKKGKGIPSPIDDIVDSYYLAKYKIETLRTQENENGS